VSITCPMIALWLTYKCGHNKHTETDMLNIFQQEQIMHDYQMLLLLSYTSQKPLCFVKRKTNLMRNLFVVYFVKLYMFRAYLGPSSGGTTLCIQQFVFIILLSWLSVVLVGLELRISCASFGFSLHDYIEMRRKQNIKPLCLFIAA
jgi:hypothetical protein